MYQLFAVCAPGIEQFTAQELQQLGFSIRFQEHGEEGGGIEFQGTLRDIYRANLHLRTASRVLLRYANFVAATFPELKRKASRLDWESCLQPGKPIALRVTCRKSRLYHSDAVAERIAGAISDRLGSSVPVKKVNENASGEIPQLIVVRLKNNCCTISIDTSGALLHRRGYRLATAKAPLRETVAAAMLLSSGWDTQFPLVDPFCGSGTIPIEAALMARNIAPGLKKNFAFMNWSNYNPKIWETLLIDAESQEFKSHNLKITASDRDEGAIKAAMANAERAGVRDCIEFSCHAVSAIEPAKALGWIITNPPYGVRVSEGKDLRNLYAQFGNVLRKKCPGWHFAMLCTHPQLQHSTKLNFESELSLINGGLKVKLLKGRVV